MFGPTVVMACRMPLRKCLSQVSLAAALVCAWQTGLAAGAADDLVELPFEELLETEVTGAAGFVREVTDAPSAVSVVTAEEIRQFGYRTLAEVLENLLGLVLDFDGAYYYTSARGYGLPGEYFGRYVLVIDGYPVADNVYNQIFFGDDGLLDVSVIDRVEYVPGPGAAIYGNNAFLGAIHVFTRKGRDMAGGELATSWGSHNNHKTRLNLGGRTEDGTDWLLSAAVHGNDVNAWISAAPVRFASTDRKLFFKARRGGWWAETALAQREMREGVAEKSTDTYAFWQLGRDVDWNDWKASFRLYQGGYDYAYRASDGGTLYRDKVGGAWWGGQTQLATSIWAGHRVVFGLEYRADQRLRSKHEEINESDGEFQDYALQRGDRVRNLGVYLQDEIQLAPTLDLSLALRHDRRTSAHKMVRRTNPRLALVYRPGGDTSVKVSHGTASRWSSWDEIRYGLGDKAEKFRTTEVVLDHQWPALGLRSVGSLYRYRMSNLLASSWMPDLTYLHFQGGELALEWRWSGTTIKTSYAHQHARANDGKGLINSPSDVGKVQVSVPLVTDRWRVSLAWRVVASRVSRNLDEEQFTIPGYAVTDLTFHGRNVAIGLDVTFGVRNLFDRRYGSIVNPYLGDERGAFVRDGRTYWLQLEYRFR
ncbi:TonB-dependent receptor plug domain-containing protein [Hydrogenophaga aquatica]